MCEKNFEGKEMSLFPNDELDDVVEDMLINDDSDEVVIRTHTTERWLKIIARITKRHILTINVSLIGVVIVDFL